MDSGRVPALSVIVRTLGRPQLAEALESLASQTSLEIEPVIVDMSEHGVDRVVAALRARMPHTVHVRVGRRLDRSRALNTGIEHAGADTVSILDDDNLYAPGHASSLLNGLVTTGADLVYSGVCRHTLTPDGALLDERLVEAPFNREQLLLGNYIYATATAFRKSIWRIVGRYDVRFPVYEDWEFLIRVAFTGCIRSIEGSGAIVRCFTGDPARAAHTMEADACARSLERLFTKHRRRYTAGVLRTRPDLLDVVPEARRGLDPTWPWLAEWWWQSIVTRGGRAS